MRHAYEITIRVAGRRAPVVWTRFNGTADEAAESAVRAARDEYYPRSCSVQRVTRTTVL